MSTANGISPTTTPRDDIGSTRTRLVASTATAAAPATTATTTTTTTTTTTSPVLDLLSSPLPPPRPHSALESTAQLASPIPRIQLASHTRSHSLDHPSASPLSNIIAAAASAAANAPPSPVSSIDLNRGQILSPLAQQQMSSAARDNSALVTDPLLSSHYSTQSSGTPPHLTISIPAPYPPAHGSSPPTRNGFSNQAAPPAAASPAPLSFPLPVPQLQPSTGSTLGSLPLLSPISPLEANSFASYSLNDNLHTSNGNTAPNPDDDTWAPPPPLSASSAADGRRTSISRSAARLLASQLQIQVPLHLSPKKSSFDLDSPRLRESPTVPRRRTIIEAPDITRRATPVQAVPRHSTDDHLLEHQTTPRSRSQDQSEVFEYDLVVPSSPSPAPKRRLDSPVNILAPARRVSLSSDQGSPAQKRSLPPTRLHSSNDPSHMSAVETIPMPMPLTMPIPAPAMGPRPSSNYTSSPPLAPPQTSPRSQFQGGLQFPTASVGPIPVPSPRIAPPSPERSRTGPRPVASSPQQQQQKSSSMPTPVPLPFNPRHQSTNSASNLPAIAGLADAGPYPTAAPPQMSNPNASLAIPGAGGGGAPGASRGIPRQEEVCLECMMRDRDLADINVQGEGVWERASDVGWKDLQEREHELMRGWLGDRQQSVSGTSFDDASSESQSQTRSSPLSQVSGLPEEKEILRKQAGDARRSREDHDAQIARVGWRGFKWEEGTGGEGFPRGFRGTRGGALTERGIKNVMTMYPSSSALRYQILQGYLRGQYRLIMDIRQDAQRLGHYPEPEEPYYPTSPTISSHESSGASGSKPPPRRNPQRSMDLGAPSIKATSISTARSAPAMAMPSAPTLRQSPSTPAGLGSQVTQARRPKTYYSDREPLPTHPTLNLTSPNPNQTATTRASHYKVPSGGSTMPKGRQSTFYANDDWSDAEDLWPPASPASGNLRPFSFAVRAGAAGGQGSEGGHSRRSIFGRFGGSVTSLFTGNTHGGSGSMMDMHLGLEADRRNRTSSYQVHEPPRVMGGGLSPSRPPLNSRQSMASSMYLSAAEDLQPQQQSTARERPRSRSVSGSRLTQVSLYDDVDEPPHKKKGLKGLLQKMKPKNKRDRSSTLVGISIDPSSRPQQEVSTSSELAPPPPMPFLIGHNRQRSGSSASIGDDGSTPSLSPQMATAPGGNSSVSAPVAPSSGSGSVSPTSSRFQVDRREDSMNGTRRRTEPTLELPPGAADPSFNRGSAVMEMLSGNPTRDTITTPVTPIYDEPQSFRADLPNGNMQNSIPSGYRKSKQPSLSSRYSTSTTTVPAIETPDPGASAAYLIPHQLSSPTGTLSPNANRHKNLPPLPPPGAAPPQDGYPEDQSFSRASLYEQQKRMSTATSGSYPRSSMDPRTSMMDPRTSMMDPRTSMMDSRTSMMDPRISMVDSRSSMMDPRTSLAMSEAPTVHRAALPPSADYFPTASPRYHQPQPPHIPPSPGTEYMQPPKPLRALQPRASFDVLSDGRARRGSTANSAMLMPGMNDDDLRPPSMYIQRGAAASTGSFGRFLKGNEVAHNAVITSVPQTEDRKERRRGIKSIFGKRG